MSVVEVRACQGKSRAGHTLHDTTEGVEYGLGGEILRWNEIDEMFLSSFLLLNREPDEREEERSHQQVAPFAVSPIWLGRLPPDWRIVAVHVCSVLVN